jgi:hypothetical protein
MILTRVSHDPPDANGDVSDGPGAWVTIWTGYLGDRSVGTFYRNPSVWAMQTG